MSYFSRLTDIVTCNLSDILADEADPKAAIGQIIHEMQEGLAGAERSVKTAAANEQRIRRDIDEHGRQIAFWTAKAKDALSRGDEEKARQALARKQEVADLIAGLKQQHQAALATHEHLSTMLRALEARLAEARRKKHQLETGQGKQEDLEPAWQAGSAVNAAEESRKRQIEEELEALKRELGQ